MRKLFFLLPLFIGLCTIAEAQDARALYEEGVKLKDQKKTAAAAEKFKQAIELRPGYTEALYELGWCRNDGKDYKAAIEVLRQVMPVWSDVYKANFELGYAFEKTSDSDSALFYYNRCIEINPDNANVYKQLGNIAYQNDENEEALKNYMLYEERVKVPITDYLHWYRKGFLKNALKDYASAKPSLLKSLEFKTDYINTYLELGFSCARLKEDEQAIGYYKKAIEMDPKSHIGYNGIGEVYRDNKKDRVTAMEWYKKTLGINPRERKANFGMGYCLNSEGKYSEAIPYLKVAIEMEKTYTAAYVELGYSYYRAGSNTEAMSYLKEAVKLNPQNENSRYYMGLIYINQKDKTNAQRMVDELKLIGSKNTASLQEKVNKMQGQQ